MRTMTTQVPTPSTRRQGKSSCTRTAAGAWRNAPPRAAKEITGVSRVITGHGRWPGSKPNSGGLQGWPAWNDFVENAEFTREFVDGVTAAWKKGRTAGQVAAELTMPEKYKDYRLDGARAMIDTIFNELKQFPAAKR
jgi:hypothetical protein